MFVPKNNSCKSKQADKSQPDKKYNYLPLREGVVIL